MTDMIKGLFDGKRWAALWKAVPDYYVPGFIMTLKISAAGLLTALILGVIFGTFSTMKFKPAKILSRIYVEFIQNTPLALQVRSEEHTSELQSRSVISYAVFCLKKISTRAI